MIPALVSFIEILEQLQHHRNLARNISNNNSKITNNHCHFLSIYYVSDTLHTLFYRDTSEILQVWFQTTTVKWISQWNKSWKFFGFPVYIKVMLGTSMAVQWLRLCAPTAGGMGSFIGEIRSHMLHGMAEKQK